MNNQSAIRDKIFIPPSEIRTMLKKLPKRQFYWGPIVKGGIGLVVGPSKSGKTTLCENFSFCLSAGRENFLGRKLNHCNSKIGLALLEEPFDLRAERHISIFNSFSKDEQERIDKHLLILNHHDGYLTQPKSWKKFTEDVKKADVDILVIDSLTRLTNKKISESDVASKVMKELRQLQRVLDITLIVIHHTTKLHDNKFPEMDNIKGSTEVVQESDFAIALGKYNHQLCLKPIASRYTKPENNYIILEIDDNQKFRVKGDALEIDLKKASDGRYDNSGPTKLLETFKLLSQDTEDGLVKTKALIKKSEFNSRRVHEYKKKLVKEGFIEQTSKGLYKLIE
ncbi:MAG: AAA family ATPase [Balneolaceae bacterium]